MGIFMDGPSLQLGWGPRSDLQPERSQQAFGTNGRQGHGVGSVQSHVSSVFISGAASREDSAHSASAVYICRCSAVAVGMTLRRPILGYGFPLTAYL